MFLFSFSLKLVNDKTKLLKMNKFLTTSVRKIPVCIIVVSHHIMSREYSQRLILGMMDKTLSRRF